MNKDSSDVLEDANLSYSHVLFEENVKEKTQLYKTLGQTDNSYLCINQDSCIWNGPTDCADHCVETLSPGNRGQLFSTHTRAYITIQPKIDCVTHSWVIKTNNETCCTCWCPSVRQSIHWSVYSLVRLLTADWCWSRGFGLGPGRFVWFHSKIKPYMTIIHVTSLRTI